MAEKDLKDKILNVLDKSKFGTLATVKNNKPHSRYMTYHHDDLTLYTPTDKDTHKTEEIEENPNVHILLGYNGDGLKDAFVEVEGTATIKSDQDLKDKLWSKNMEKWFDGPNDPNYIVLEIKPTLYRLMNSDSKTPQVLKV
ncbi:pyridoxamine 5'-phosphate oxidase family protein [Pseudalkalibacillus berkeleyi]|uniref:Pyridoxamine 5'-phosphate oxidase family protein n=1 Tax=Pseudalkalibacillus berkeleyi TaxID=1069813 RepID=A0ABS9H5S6_9BACL|nr:pyridoxamine 5'-phosphate oxidase family protein [Pseudalkalibacillus berkeleyi]MCF6139251.1 pyridoxamine 5'-phosphate oxidase family protein [Pseudalkalibacillus berkeleyi]